MSKVIDKEDIEAIECRFATHCRPPDGESTDITVVKEVVHLKDKTTQTNIRIIDNYQRPFWITKKGAQDHADKKEWEKLKNLNRYMSTQTELQFAVAKSIGQPWFRGKMRQLQRNQFIYGTDITSTAILKHAYQDKYPDHITPYTVAAFDVETDVIHGTEEIIMATLSFKDRIITVVKASFVEGHSDLHNQLNGLMTKYLDVYVQARKIKWEVVVVDHAVNVITECYRRAHKWRPDFVAIWNINFDMPKMLATLEKAGVHPKDVFSDPSVPKKYKFFDYKVGPNKKVTASGKVTPIKPSAQWHSVFCPSSFYFIDAMCAYRHIRTGSAEEPSYALDAILKKHKLGGKLKFVEADGFTGIEWHQFMQANYPLEYIIYNVFDCIAMEELDEVTRDLSLTLPLFSGCSDFDNFKSQPRRLADSLHFFCLQNQRAIGCTSDQMATDFDKETIGLDGWIVTLPANLVLDNGLQIIAEDPNLRTNARAHVADLDVSASYPNGGSVFNISRETTHIEVLSIEGVTEAQRRSQGINLSAGATNAVEVCTELFGLPSMETLLASYRKRLNTPLQDVEVVQ